MGQQDLQPRKSWLSLVAETAGVSGATVARLEIQGFSEAPWVRAIVQVHDDRGAVIGASAWEGGAEELAAGISLDVGCDLGAAWGSRVVGWLETRPGTTDPSKALAPWDAAARYFDPTRAMKLMLHGGALVRAAQPRTNSLEAA